MYVEAQPAGDADLASVGALLAEPARTKVLLALSDRLSGEANAAKAESASAETKRAS